MDTDQTPGQDESRDVLIDVMNAEGDDMDQDNTVNQDVSDGEDDTLHHRRPHHAGMCTSQNDTPNPGMRVLCRFLTF